MKLKPVRIGLWDQYGGSMPSGWIRWMFEQYEFPFEVVFPRTLDAGNLAAKYDVPSLSLAPASATATPPGLQAFSPGSSQDTTLIFTNTTGSRAASWCCRS